MITWEEVACFSGLADYIKRVNFMVPERYSNLFRLILLNHCYNIVEIGVFDGRNARWMIETAQVQSPGWRTNYHGFDLFEDLNDDDLEREFSKRALPIAEVKDALDETGASVTLVRGNTIDTLPNHLFDIYPVPDFIFIDGGHSEETIASDWWHINKEIDSDAIVVFDDYYPNRHDAMAGLGCNSVIDALDRELYEVEFLQPVDSFEKDWGTLDIQMVKVCLK